MKLQILSDLHLESETFDPEPAAGAELLVLAGDIDTRWTALERFRGWPVPVLMVAGNHEFDGRDLGNAWEPLRAACEASGIQLLQRQEAVLTSPAGRRVRFLGATRWSDFDLFGEKGRPKAERAAGYYLKKMGSTLGGRPLDTAALRAEGQACRAWLEQTLALRAAQPVDHGHHADHGKHPHRDAEHRQRGPQFVRRERRQREAENFGAEHGRVIRNAAPPPDRVCSPATPARTR